MTANRSDVADGMTTYNALITYLDEIESADGNSAGILYIELDDPARFNDLFGHNSDKVLLRTFVSRLEAALTYDMLAKVGAYRFAIVYSTIESIERLEKAAGEIVNLLREPMGVGENLVYLTGTVGVASSVPGESASMLVKRAERAMADAKKEGRNRIGSDASETLFSSKEELRLMRDMPHAIDRGDIYFVYQPQYDYQQCKFTGAEILVRWRHPDIGDVMPDVFIPLAEISGMIVPLMTRTLIEAAQMFSRLELEGITDFSLAVNLPFQVLMEESFFHTVDFLMDAYALAGKKLTFEIMEDTIPDHLESFTAHLEKIKSMGFSLAVDDYGTGHTSLTYLLHFPVDYIKVDRLFVRNIHKSRRTYLLFQSIVDMAKALELSVVVEGVECEEEDAIVKRFGDITVQGYFYSKPVSAESLSRLLSKQSDLPV